MAHGSTDTNGFKPSSNLTNKTSAEGKNSYVLLSTGSSEKVKKMNLYDVAGNLWEWTDEAAYINSSYPNSDYPTHVIRGGSFNDAHASYPACYRGCDSALYTHTGHGFRPALFIK